MGGGVEYPDENTLNIYTDGSSLPKPRRGGIGMLFVVINDAGEEEAFPVARPGYEGASNNLMELEACVQALRLATGQQRPFPSVGYRMIVLKTDSEYVASHFDTAIFGWSREGWCNRDGAPIANAPQWKELVKLARKAARQGTPLQIKWVPGKKSPRTKTVDKMAKASAKLAQPRQLNPSAVRRKRTDQPIEIGSVEMRGQRLTVHVFKTEYLKLHGLVKCWYSVVSKASPFYKNVSVIYADPNLLLRRGHTYRVRVNEDTANPRVLKVFQQVD